MRHRPRFVPLLALSVLLASCGGGGGADATASDDEGSTSTAAEGGPGGTDPRATGDAALRDLLASVVADDATEPGCAVAVLDDGDVVAAYAGQADLANGVPIGADTVFDIGSLSKQFTAAAVVLLARDGLIDLQADLHTYLPDLPDYGAAITVEQALHHTSGVPDYIGPLGDSFAEEDVTTAADAFVVVRVQAFTDFAPGTSWSYSNANYFLLGLIVEQVTGLPLEQVLRERLADPLGLDSFTLRDDHTELIPSVATAYAPGDDGFAVAMTNWEQVGDGAAHATIGDVLRWQAASAASGDVGGVDLWAELRAEGADMGDGVTRYARGVIESEHDGVATVGHTGSSAGYRSALEATPDDGRAAAVLCNRADVDAGTLALGALGLEP